MAESLIGAAKHNAALLPFADLAYARRKVGGVELRPKLLQDAMNEAFQELTLKLFGKPLNEPPPSQA